MKIATLTLGRAAYDVESFPAPTEQGGTAKLRARNPETGANVATIAGIGPRPQKSLTLTREGEKTVRAAILARKATIPGVGFVGRGAPRLSGAGVGIVIGGTAPASKPRTRKASAAPTGDTASN